MRLYVNAATTAIAVATTVVLALPIMALANGQNNNYGTSAEEPPKNDRHYLKQMTMMDQASDGYDSSLIKDGIAENDTKKMKNRHLELEEDESEDEEAPKIEKGRRLVDVHADSPDDGSEVPEVKKDRRLREEVGTDDEPEAPEIEKD